LPSDKGGNTIVYIGRFVEKKNPLVVIQALEALSVRFPNLTLEMIGDGPLLAEAKALVERLGLSGHVRFKGEVTHSAVRDQLSTASVLIQPSGWSRSGDAEGLPSVIQEGMASGCVVVATDHAGVREVIEHGENGLLVSQPSVSEVAKTVEQVLVDSAMRYRIGENARARAVARLDCWRIQHDLEAVIREYCY